MPSGAHDISDKMTMLNDALERFKAEMVAQGLWDDVVIVCTSDFVRVVATWRGLLPWAIQSCVGKGGHLADGALLHVGILCCSGGVLQNLTTGAVLCFTRAVGAHVDLEWARLGPRLGWKLLVNSLTFCAWLLLRRDRCSESVIKFTKSRKSPPRDAHQLTSANVQYWLPVHAGSWAGGSKGSRCLGASQPVWPSLRTRA